MKQIDVLFPAYINAAIGPCGTLRRLLNNKCYLENRGYNINIFTLDNVLKRDVNSNDAIDFSKGLRFRSKVKSVLSRTIVGYVLMQKHSMRLAKKLVDFYLSLERNADVVIFHETNTCMMYEQHKKEGQKIVCFFHSDGTKWGMIIRAHPFLENSWWIKRQDRKMDLFLPKIDRYVFIAKIGQTNFLQENPTVSLEKTSFFHNGIEDLPLLDTITASSKKYRMCSVGTLSHRKGQYIIIEALHRLPKSLIEKMSLTLYGMGADYGYLRAKIDEYGLQDTVILYGNLINSNVHYELSKHNIFILMSNNEGLPISIIEAMRAGLPVISTKVSGIPEEVDERNGILLNPNVDELTKVLSNIEYYDWASLGRNSRLRFENEFTFKSMLDGYCSMIDSLFES